MRSFVLPPIGRTFATALLAALVWTGEARADDALVNPTADSLFKAGRELMYAQRFTEACAKFEESYRLDASAGTLLNLGRCNEALGKTATAWSLYKRSITLGNATNKPRHVSAAQEFLEAVDAKLARVVVTVAEPAPGLALTCGSVEIGEASRGLPLPFDPGTYSVVAEAPGYQRFEREIVASEGRTASLEVPPLVKKAAPPPPPPTEPPAAAATGPQPLFVIGASAIGLGLVGLSIGTAFGVMTLDAASEAENDPSLCPEQRCSAAGLRFIDEAETKATVSTATLITGGLLVGGGLALVTLAAVDRGGLGNVALVPRLADGDLIAGLDVVGRW